MGFFQRLGHKVSRGVHRLGHKIHEEAGVVHRVAQKVGEVAGKVGKVAGMVNKVSRGALPFVAEIPVVGELDAGIVAGSGAVAGASKIVKRGAKAVDAGAMAVSKLTR